jgi:hypothetical protein
MYSLIICRHLSYLPTCGRLTRSQARADFIADHEDYELHSLTLGGGIKGWVKAGETYTKHMDGFEPEYWKQVE